MRKWNNQQGYQKGWGGGGNGTNQSPYNNINAGARLGDNLQFNNYMGGGSNRKIAGNHGGGSFRKGGHSPNPGSHRKIKKNNFGGGGFGGGGFGGGGFGGGGFGRGFGGRNRMGGRRGYMMNDFDNLFQNDFGRSNFMDDFEWDDFGGDFDDFFGGHDPFGGMGPGGFGGHHHHHPHPHHGGGGGGKNPYGGGGGGGRGGGGGGNPYLNPGGNNRPGGGGGGNNPYGGGGGGRGGGGGGGNPYLNPGGNNNNNNRPKPNPPDNKDGYKMFGTKKQHVELNHSRFDPGLEPDEDERNRNLDKNGDQREWNNWVIKSFIPKKPVNIPGLNNNRNNNNLGPGGGGYNLNKSISFVAESQKYNNLLAQLQRSNQKYTDPKFPPRPESIIGFGERHAGNHGRFSRMQWRRPEEVFRGQPFTIFNDTINPDDVKQGILGDCYFLAAASSIAEHQDRIKKLFLSRKVNKAGCYCVALCINGLWEEIILDDWIPCEAGTLQIAFNHTQTRELWAILLEKAWAKAHGGYLNIDGGVIREALRDLTGAPCMTYFCQEDNEEVHWQRLLEAEKNHWVMTAASGDIRGTGNDSRDNRTGLSGNHAYSMLAAYEIDGSGRLVQHGQRGSPHNQRIVKMRNPWAKGEWKGAWSDQDRHKWTHQMKTMLGHSTKEDGVFFMPFKDFMRYFHDYQICFYEDKYKYSAQRFKTSATKPTMLEFDIRRPGEYYLSLNQINKRFFRKSDRKCSNFLLLEF